MTKEIDWWCHCKFLVTSITIGFLPVNCTQVTWASQRCYQILSSFQKVPSFNFIPYLKVEVLLRFTGVNLPLTEQLKNHFAKETKMNWLIYILRGNIQNSSNLKVHSLPKYNEWLLASLREFIKLQLLSCK